MIDDHVQIAILSDYIYRNPMVVVRVLKKHGYKIKGRVTYTKINGQVVNHLADPALAEELNKLINPDYKNFIDPVSLALASAAFATAVGSSVVGAVIQKKVREKQQAIALMQLQQNQEMQAANIEQEADAKKKQIMLNTAQEYKEGLDLIASKDKDQETAIIFFGVAAISTAILIRTLIVKL